MKRQALTLERAVAAELRAWFARTELPQERAAEVVGMHPNTLSRKLNGHSNFSLAEVDAVATYLGTSAEVVIADARQRMA